MDPRSRQHRSKAATTLCIDRAQALGKTQVDRGMSQAAGAREPQITSFRWGWRHPSSSSSMSAHKPCALCGRSTRMKGRGRLGVSRRSAIELISASRRCDEQTASRTGRPVLTMCRLELCPSRESCPCHDRAHESRKNVVCGGFGPCQSSPTVKRILSCSRWRARLLSRVTMNVPIVFVLSARRCCPVRSCCSALRSAAGAVISTPAPTFPHEDPSVQTWR